METISAPAHSHVSVPLVANRKAGRWAGNALLAIALLHCAFGLLAGARVIKDPELQALVGDRALLFEMRPPLGSTTPLQVAHVALFWFLAFGVALLPLGAVIRHLERTAQEVPRSLAWQLAALAVAGGVFLPASGFWLALIPAWNIWRKN